MSDSQTRTATILVAAKSSNLEKILSYRPPVNPAPRFREALIAAARILDKCIRLSGANVTEGQLKLIVARAYIDRQISGSFRQVREVEVRWAYGQLHGAAKQERPE